jgi:hypothetical protein
MTVCMVALIMSKAVLKSFETPAQNMCYFKRCMIVMDLVLCLCTIAVE